MSKSWDSMLTYEHFLEEREHLITIIQELTLIANSIGVNEKTATNLDRLLNIVTNEVFRVLVVGSFSRGKSTLVNCLLGEELLPAEFSPTTAAITIIKYGENPRITLHHKERDGTNLTNNISPHELKKYLKIPKGSLIKTDNGNTIKTDIDKAVIEYPLELCKNGVEIIDSPGLEENRTRQKITLDFLNKCDAVIVVLSCIQLITLEEEFFINEELLKRSYNHIFYVINFSDEINDFEEERDILERAEEKLNSRDRIYLISSKEVLNSRKSHGTTNSYVQDFAIFEKQLEEYLINKKGRHKLNSSSDLIDHIKEELLEKIDKEIQCLKEESLEEITNIEKKFHNNVILIYKRKDVIVKKIREHSFYLGELVTSEFGLKCKEISEELDSYARNLQFDETFFGAVISRRSNYKKMIIDEINKYINLRIEHWAKHGIKVLLNKEMKRFFDIIDDDLRIILEEIDCIKKLLIPNYSPDFSSFDSFDRIVKTSTLTSMEKGTAWKGGALYFGGILTSNVLLFLLELLNPITGFITIIGIGYLVITSQKEKALETIRRSIADQVVPELINLPDKEASNIKNTINKEMNSIYDSIEKGINKLIQEVESELSLAKKEDQLEKKNEKIKKYAKLKEQIIQLGI